MSTGTETRGEAFGHLGSTELYVALAVIVAVVNDGWSDRPSPFFHQILVLPFTIAFAFGAYQLLRDRGGLGCIGDPAWQAVRACIVVCAAFEFASLAGFWYERHHFARFGYAFGPARTALLLCAVAGATAFVFWRRTGPALLGAASVAFGAGLLLAIASFPLNYLRSDMLPVIVWSDQRLAAGLNPYATIHVGSRLYDFPYLPGMLVAYLPAIAAHVDPRFFNLVCVLCVGLLVYRTSTPERRVQAAALLATFLLSPFLQYRHDLYLAPHWLALTGALTLAQRKHHVWAAVVFGISMAIYQLSWVLFPFLLLYGFRRRGWSEVIKLGGAGIGAALLMLGPFLPVATDRIANNTVGQWGRLPHALADPMNLSYWLTFLVRPDQLKWLQLVTMAAIFFFCIARGRCATLTDTLRWMSGALAVFVAMNVIVDGYFYLTVLLVLLVFTCLQTGTWQEPEAGATVHPAPQDPLRPALA